MPMKAVNSYSQTLRAVIEKSFHPIEFHTPYETLSLIIFFVNKNILHIRAPIPFSSIVLGYLGGFRRFFRPFLGGFADCKEIR